MDLGELLDDLYRERGRLTPEDVVAAATPKRSPLHPFLTWDDGEAAHKYRLLEAGTLIRSVKITYVTSRQTEDRINRWRAVRTEGTGRTYMPVEQVVSDPILNELHRRDMERAWRALLARYQSYEEFRAMVYSDLGETG